jgi:hypothetical protein
MKAGLGGLPQGMRKPLPVTVPMMQIRIMRMRVVQRRMGCQ